jgi:hypothetical protein
MQPNGTMTPARIGSPIGYFIFGIIALVIGAILAIGDGLAAMGTANFITTLGAVLVAVGFWISLFGKIEQRLMDVEVAIVKGHLGQLTPPTEG